MVCHACMKGMHNADDNKMLMDQLGSKEYIQALYYGGKNVGCQSECTWQGMQYLN